MSLLLNIPATETRPLENHVPITSLAVGIAPSGSLRPLKCDEDGILETGLSFTGDITVGEVSFSQTAGENVVVIGSSALPTGAASESTLTGAAADIADVKTAAESLDTKVTACNTGAVVVASLPATTTAASTAYAASLIAKGGAGRLFSVNVYNSGPATFLQVFNAATVPANGAAPILTAALPAQASISLEWANGLTCSTGITLVSSTTGPTKTLASEACYFTASVI